MIDSSALLGRILKWKAHSGHYDIIGWITTQSYQFLSLQRVLVFIIIIIFCIIRLPTFMYSYCFYYYLKGDVPIDFGIELPLLRKICRHLSCKGFFLSFFNIINAHLLVQWLTAFRLLLITVKCPHGCLFNNIQKCEKMKLRKISTHTKSLRY